MTDSADREPERPFDPLGAIALPSPNQPVGPVESAEGAPPSTVRSPIMPLDDVSAPDAVLDVLEHVTGESRDALRLIPTWRNMLGGLTFRVERDAGADLFIKWNPAGNEIDLEREREKSDWFAERIGAPVFLASGSDAHGDWLVSQALPGRSAVDAVWLAQPRTAVIALARALRAVHALPVAEAPLAWRTDGWANRRPPTIEPRPPIDELVVIQGDACAPNTLLDDDGGWCAVVDLGDAAVADRWADLAVASMSLEWNYGTGWDALFWQSYGIEPDTERIAYYRALWELES